MFVLILVLMEVALGATQMKAIYPKGRKVLILVLMEVALGDISNEAEIDDDSDCLNPCFNGSCSWSPKRCPIINKITSLNPCFNGSCSWRYQ